MISEVGETEVRGRFTTAAPGTHSRSPVDIRETGKSHRTGSQ